MTSAADVSLIEGQMMKRPGMVSAVVTLANSKGRFTYDTEATGPRNVIDAVQVEIHHY